MTCGLLHALAELWFIIKLFLDQLSYVKVSKNCEFLAKIDLLLRWDEMSQQSWKKICGQNVTDFGTKFYSESVCHPV